MATAYADPMEAARVRLIRFYAHYNPGNLNKVDDILQAYYGEIEQLFSDLCNQYGPEPSEAQVKIAVKDDAIDARNWTADQPQGVATRNSRVHSDWHDESPVNRSRWFDEDDRPVDGHWVPSHTKADPLQQTHIATARDPASYRATSVPRSGPGAVAFSPERFKSGTTIALSPRNSVVAEETVIRQRAERLYLQAVDHVTDRERWYGRDTVDNVAAYQALVRERAKASRGTYVYDELMGFRSKEALDRHTRRLPSPLDARVNEQEPEYYAGYEDHLRQKAAAQPQPHAKVRGLLEKVRWVDNGPEDHSDANINQHVGGAGWTATALACCAQHGFVSLPMARSRVTGNGGGDECFFAPHDPQLPPSIVRPNASFPGTYLHLDAAACSYRLRELTPQRSTAEPSPAPVDPTPSWSSQLNLTPLNVTVVPQQQRQPTGPSPVSVSTPSRTLIYGAAAPEDTAVKMSLRYQNLDTMGLDLQPYRPAFNSAMDDVLGPSVGRQPTFGHGDDASPPRLMADVVIGSD